MLRRLHRPDARGEPPAGRLNRERLEDGGGTCLPPSFLLTRPSLAWAPSAGAAALPLFTPGSGVAPVLGLGHLQSQGARLRRLQDSKQLLG